MFAIVEISGKQYKVTQGQTVSVDRMEGDIGSLVTFDRVLLLVDGKKTVIGTPTVKDAAVEAKIIEQLKGKKIQIRRFKSKVRYRKTRGFRPQLTKIEITAVGRS